ncbi:hypothetical protein [Reinekea sp.]|jgi:hypothetical protein|uniref:hypothetical protein n=1 Tax=Reinekea sp. TaxID=1970455 RepID=UPI00398945D9
MATITSELRSGPLLGIRVFETWMFQSSPHGRVYGDRNFKQWAAEPSLNSEICVG